MELRHLRYFVAVAEEENFTRASVRLGIQQPPLSQQIRALEAELGFSLFRRHRKGAVLTIAGEVFLAEARAILDKVNYAAARAGRAAHGIDGAITIGFTSSAGTHPLIPRIVRAFRELRPGVSLEVREGNAAELTEAVVANAVDVAFLRNPVIRPVGLEFRQLLVEEMMLVLPTGHSALGHRAGSRTPVISLAALRNEDFIVVRRHGSLGMQANLLNACQRLGFTPKVAVEVDRMLTNINLVAAGVGVSIVPASMKGIQEDSVVYCRIRERELELCAPLTLACKDAGENPVVQHFLAEVKGVVSQFKPQ